MTCKEITVAEWNELNYREDTYFANGCVFDEKTDNLLAFGWYEDELHEVGKYYKIVDKFIIPHSKAEQELNLHIANLEKENKYLFMDLEFAPLDYILPPPIIDDKQIFIRRVVPPKFEAVITALGTSEKKKSFFKRLWQKLKSLLLRRKLK